MDSLQAILPDALRVNANLFQTDLCRGPGCTDANSKDYTSVAEYIPVLYRGREEFLNSPLPPNRACGFPAHGSPVDSFLIGIGSLPRGLQPL